MIPITDTFQSISSEFGGALVRFPGDGAILPVQDPSSLPNQGTSLGEVTSPKQKMAVNKTKDETSSEPQGLTLGEFQGDTVGPSISMPENLDKM
jgi:hypothetical protein